MITKEAAEEKADLLERQNEQHIHEKNAIMTAQALTFDVIMQ